MGILVVAVAVFSAMGAGGLHVFRAESPGPVSERIVPRIKDTAKILYTTYIIISLLEIALLLFGGLSLFESTVHTFGTLGTGGFSSNNASIGAGVAYVFINSGTTWSQEAYLKADNAGAFDHFDSVLSTGPYQNDEIREWETLKELPAKKLFDHGHPPLSRAFRIHHSVFPNF